MATWYVLYTKARNEKKVAQLLSEKGFEVYCPLKEEIRQWSDRKKKILAPVFSSYLFVSLQDYASQNVDVLRTPGTVNFLWWNKKPGIVRDVEIQAIKDFLDNYKHAEISVDVSEGQNVIVTEGVLKGNTGIVVNVKGNRAYLRLDSLRMNIIATVPVQSIKEDKE